MALITTGAQRLGACAHAARRPPSTTRPSPPPVSTWRCAARLGGQRARELHAVLRLPPAKWWRPPRLLTLGCISRSAALGSTARPRAQALQGAQRARRASSKNTPAGPGARVDRDTGLLLQLAGQPQVRSRLRARSSSGESVSPARRDHAGGGMIAPAPPAALDHQSTPSAPVARAAARPTTPAPATINGGRRPGHQWSLLYTLRRVG
jgi:hypothetical protein